MKFKPALPFSKISPEDQSMKANMQSFLTQIDVSFFFLLVLMLAASLFLEQAGP